MLIETSRLTSSPLSSLSMVSRLSLLFSCSVSLTILLALVCTQ